MAKLLADKCNCMDNARAINKQGVGTIPPRQANQEKGLQMTTEERLEKLEQDLARVKRRHRWLVAVAILCLGALVVVWARSSGTQGRYALSGDGVAYILDTRTGHLWMREDNRFTDYGTIDNPKWELSETERKVNLKH